MAPNRIMIDFDGVLHDYKRGWNNGKLGWPIPGGKEFIDKMKDKFEIVIFTSRACNEEYPEVEEMIESVGNWLDEHEIYYDLITATKLPAVLYIDDKAIRFNNNWDKINDFIDSFVEE